MAKNTVLTLRKKVDEGGKVTMLTSYDYTMAALTEQAGIDMILVGDSLGMTMMGYDSTLPVTMDDMGRAAEMISDLGNYCASLVTGREVDLKKMVNACL